MMSRTGRLLATWELASMAEPVRKFEIVEDSEDSPSPATAGKTSPLADLGAQALYLGLQTLSKRTLVAIDNLFCLLTVFSAFFLWYKIRDPNVLQIVALSSYAAFVLAANIIVRRK
jgi:hypothetical protein